MPKIVDHDARRREIVRATWRLIARDGMEATTMRRLAEESGFANGALTLYFPNKHAILAAAFSHVFAATDRRYAEARSAGARGAAGLRALLTEILPLDENRLLEARIVIPFMEYAANDASMREIYDRLTTTWEDEIDTLLDEMADAGEASPSLDRRAYIDMVLAVSYGVQSTSVLNPASAQPSRLEALRESLISATLR